MGRRKYHRRRAATGVPVLTSCCTVAADPDADPPSTARLMVSLSSLHHRLELSPFSRKMRSSAFRVGASRS
jgi:hypothetical protein